VECSIWVLSERQTQHLLKGDLLASLGDSFESESDVSSCHKTVHSVLKFVRIADGSRRVHSTYISKGTDTQLFKCCSRAKEIVVLVVLCC
jgi:hypothetical protein